MAEAHTWQETLRTGDEEAFEALAREHMDRLLKAARHDLDYYVAQGTLHREDLTPEEITGEALIHAWEHRMQCPEQMSLRGWLLATQYRVLRGLVREFRSYRDHKAVSLDERVPINEANYDTQEWFWHWYQPDIQIKWEDITPGPEPVDLAVSLEDNEALLQEVEPETRHALLMHDEFEMSLPEVAFAMGLGVNDVATVIQQAKASLRERLPDRFDEEAYDEAMHPAPPNQRDGA